MLLTASQLLWGEQRPRLKTEGKLPPALSQLRSLSLMNHTDGGNVTNFQPCREFEHFSFRENTINTSLNKSTTLSLQERGSTPTAALFESGLELQWDVSALLTGTTCVLLSDRRKRPGCSELRSGNMLSITNHLL